MWYLYQRYYLGGFVGKGGVIGSNASRTELSLRSNAKAGS
jgi:hypothetical protein